MNFQIHPYLYFLCLGARGDWSVALVGGGVCFFLLPSEQAEGRVRGIKAELREVAKRLTEMNPGGSRWGGIQEDGEGNIEVDEIMCTK